MYQNDTDEPKRQKKKFNLFNWYFKDGKESNKSDFNALKKPTLGNFFKVLGTKLGKLLTTNLIFVFGNFPVFFLLFAISGFFDKFTPSPMYTAWGPLQGAVSISGNEAASSLTGIFGVFGEMRTFSPVTYVFFGLGLLVIFTWGFTKVGTTYIYRNMMSGEAIFPFSDFFYIVKRNKKQSFILGIIDALMTIAFIYNIYYLYTNYNASSLNSLMLFLTLAMFIIFNFIKPYAYIMIFTFDLKLTKIIKNALYFSILGIKRNLMMLLGIIIVIIINYGIFLLFMPLGMILPLLITFALIDLMGVYAAYPNIIKYMMNEKDAKAVINRTFVSKDDEEELTESSDETTLENTQEQTNSNED
ncbi:MAG: YesL family protein [Clostridia bacterium]|nr:YesL family protein [Clostridia bacterium]